MPKASSPLVCICIPTYNAEQTIRETLISILNQSYKNLIVKIVDNASEDKTLGIAEEFDDPRLSIHRNERNVGAEGNFNRCILQAAGKYTAIYHADDVYEPQMIERQVEFLERNTKVGAVFTEAIVIDQMGTNKGKLFVPASARQVDGQYDFPNLFKSILRHSNFLICPTAMVRTEIYREEIKSWRSDLFGASADLDVWLRIAQVHLISVLYQPLIRYRVSTTQGSHSLIRLRTERGEFLSVLDSYLKMPEVREFMNEEDSRHYRWLERTDRVVRAVNLVVLDRLNEAANLITPMNLPDALRAATSTRRGFVTLLVGLYIHVVCMFGMRKFGKFTIQMLRHRIQR